MSTTFANRTGYGEIIGQSPAMRELFRQIDRLVSTDITVLIHGESGTGKELVAAALHRQSARRAKPFVAVNCAGIPETLQESELFGHERGAFTGANERHIGKFEQANGGTLFLDEVAELTPAAQAKLLRALQSRSFQRVGGSGDVRSNFRLVAASHQRLADLVRRHGSVEEALAAAAGARERLERLERHDEERTRLERDVAAAEREAHGTADTLGTARRQAAGPLARSVEGHLADLGMAEARVDVRVEARELGPSGADDVRFLIAPNRGVAPGSVAETASGGELSRITLAIRVAAQERSGVPTLLFDEIDAGVGGRTARAIADKLATLAGQAQVICVTHLAQVAARADRHFRVVKVPGDPTVTRIERLEGAQVDEELARMLGGEEGSEEALQLARALRSGG